ncbi:putative transcription factor interactor and regulator CCHC(Zn) family [Helianthus annuus]|nr:putative transcription factor interactor and regulator CCHC(Zn) family [Helianthus annuus]
MLWSCASATTTQHFDRGIKEISKTDKALFDWLRHIPPKHWSMSHFTGIEAFQDEKPKKKDTGTSCEEESKSSFWKQSNREFLAKKQEKVKNGAYQRKETRTCYKCDEVGHIAWNCSQATKTKQEVPKKLKEKVVEKNEPPIDKFKIFENSTYEVGECSKTRFYKKRAKHDNQMWVVKKFVEKFGDESDSTKSEEPRVEVKEENLVPPVDDVNFPTIEG